MFKYEIYSNIFYDGGGDDDDDDDDDDDGDGKNDGNNAV